MADIHFLVPLDFSDQSLIALEQSANLAHLYHAEITLLFVKEDQLAIARLFKRTRDDEEELDVRIGELMEDAAIQVRESGVLVNCRIDRGRVYEQILKVASEVRADLIVIGVNGAQGLKKFIGSNALRVVKQSRCPVITIKGKHHRNGYQNILLPLDLSQETTQKVEHGIKMAKKFGSATLQVVSVQYSNRNELLHQRLVDQIQEVKHRIEAAGVNCVAALVRIVKGEDTLSRAIIDYAHKVEGDLIMIMTQQEDDATAYFIGSRAQSIINRSDIPVMSLVPEGKHEEHAPG